MSARNLAGLAVGDFRDRVRRPAYAVTLLAAIGLGYLAVPGKDAQWVIMQLGTYRGVYNSAYTGTAIALASALWLTLGGFYVVRNGIARDAGTGVGRLLAATPLRTTGYLAAKFLSSVLVLASMLGVLTLTALVMQLSRGESSQVDPVALVLPFLWIALPLVALTAAAALLFEAVPLLRTGLGNILWFFVWLVLALGGQGGNAPLGGLGVSGVVESIRADMEARNLSTSGEFSLGLTYLEAPLLTFEWGGFTPGAGLLTSRLVLIVIAVVAALLPALWFDRFDPAKNSGPRPAPADGDGLAGGRGGRGCGPGDQVLPQPAVPAEEFAPDRSAPVGRAPITPAERGGASARLLVGEVRILLQGVSRWWWPAAAAVTVAGLAVPISGVTRFVLPAAWVLPVLIWSRLGTLRHEYGVEALLGAYPTARRRMLAEWVAGLGVTALLGAAPLVRMVLVGDGPGAAAWVAGVLFIPSLALLLGSLSRTHRLFQAVYLPLWYTAVNGFPALDFIGTARVDGRPAGPAPLVLGGLALAMVLTVHLTAVARRRLG